MLLVEKHKERKSFFSKSVRLLRPILTRSIYLSKKMMSESEIEKWKPIANHWISTKTSSVFSIEKILITIPSLEGCLYCGNEDVKHEAKPASFKLGFCSLFCEEVFMRNFYPFSNKPFFVNFELLTNKSKNELRNRMKNFPEGYEQFFLTSDFSSKTFESKRVIFCVEIVFFKNFLEIGRDSFEITTHIKLCFCNPFVSEKLLTYDKDARQDMRLEEDVSKDCLVNEHDASETSEQESCESLDSNKLASQCYWCTREKLSSQASSQKQRQCLACKQVVSKPICHKDRRSILQPFCSVFCKNHFLFRNQLYDNVVQSYPIKLPQLSLIPKDQLTYLKNKIMTSKKYTIDCKPDANGFTIYLKLSRKN